MEDSLAAKYIDIALDRLSTVISQHESVREIGGFIAQVIQNGKKVYVMDRFGIVDADLVERPSCLVLFRPFKSEEDDITSGDIFILSSFFADDADDLDLIARARSRGAATVTISPEGSLSRSADRALTNEASGENGVITIPGIDKRFCPVSGIVNMVLAWALAAEVAESLIKSQTIPSVFRGEYLAGSAGKNIEARKRYLSNGS